MWQIDKIFCIKWDIHIDMFDSFTPKDIYFATVLRVYLYSFKKLRMADGVGSICSQWERVYVRDLKSAETCGACLLYTTKCTYKRVLDRSRQKYIYRIHTPTYIQTYLYVYQCKYVLLFRRDSKSSCQLIIDSRGVRLY